MIRKASYYGQAVHFPAMRTGNMATVRPIRDDDALSFRAVLDSVCRERRYLAQLEAPPLERVRTFISTNVRANHAQFVAEVEGTIVGWCDAIPGEPLSGTTHVGRLGMGILQAYRQQGIGRQLVGATLQKAAMNGLLKVELTVHASNLAAIALYRGTGFVEEGRRVRGWFVDGTSVPLILPDLQSSNGKSRFGSVPSHSTFPSRSANFVS